MKIKDYIYLLIIGVLLIIVLFFRGNDVVVVKEEINHQNTIDSLNYVIKSKDDTIVFSRNKVDSLEQKNNVLSGIYNKKLLEIQKIKNEAHKKDSVINFYNVDELEHFFSKRYE